MRSLNGHSTSSVLARLTSTLSDHGSPDFSLVISLHLGFLLVRHVVEKVVSLMVVRDTGRLSRLVIPVGKSHGVFSAHLARLSHRFIIVNIF